MKKTKKLHFSYHHKKCRSNGGTNEPENLVHVPDHLHRAWHCLFNNHTPQEIADIINAVWLDHDFTFKVERRRK